MYQNICIIKYIRINEIGNINQIYSSSAEDIKIDVELIISLTK
jgi:hypothetical protein